MYRVVLDPGVLISALLSSSGAPAQLYLRWKRGEFELVVSPRLLAELVGVLQRPRFRSYVSLEEAEAYVALLKREATIVPDPGVQYGLTRDPGDDYLAALARAANADYLVSGDGDILEMPNPQPPVLTPRGLTQLLEDRGASRQR